MADADGFQYSDMNEGDLKEVIAFMGEHFFPREALNMGLNMTHEDNKEWLSHSAADWVRSGVSVVARDPDTGEISGTLFSTILTREQTEVFKITNTCLNPKMKILSIILSKLEAAVDFFERYEKVNRILEHAMLTVSKEMAGRGVGRRLIQESEKRGRHLGCQLAIAQATSSSSQWLFYKMGYETLYTMDYTTFEIAGSRVLDIDRMYGTHCAKVVARQLEPHEESEESSQ